MQATLHKDQGNLHKRETNMANATTSLEKRDILVAAYENGNDYIQIAEYLGMKKRMAYALIKRYKDTGMVEALPTGGNRSSVLNDEMKRVLISFVEEKPTSTLMELAGKLREQFPETQMPSRMTISRALDGEMYTLKMLRSIPVEWNSDRVKDERKVYTEWLLDICPSKSVIYLDECGFNIWTARTHGRSFRGQRAVRIVSGQRGKNLTVLLAVSPQHGLVHFTLVDGGMTKELFGLFLGEVSTLLGDEELVLIFDIAPAHRDPPTLQSPLHDHQYLPKYSPFLNITEMAISCLKSHAKQRLSEPSIQATFSSHGAAAALGKTLHQYRMDILK